MAPLCSIHQKLQFGPSCVLSMNYHLWIDVKMFYCIHYGLAKGNPGVTTRNYSMNFKRNNSVIETWNCVGMVESLVVVPKPCNCERGANCCCRELLVFYKQLQQEHIQPAIYDAEIHTNIAKCLVKVKISNELCVLTCEDIVAKCIEIEHGGQLCDENACVWDTLNVWRLAQTVETQFVCTYMMI